MCTYMHTYVVNFFLFVDLDVFQDYVRNNNPIGAFSFLMHELEILFEQRGFQYIKPFCEVKNGEYSPALLSQVQKANSTKEIFVAFNFNHLYCNWLNTRLLTTIATNAKIFEAVKLIQHYEECFYSKPASYIKVHQYKVKYFKSAQICIKVLAKVNHKGNIITVKQIIEYVSILELIMELPEGSLNIESLTEFACIEINCLIPSHCSLHAHKMSEKNHLRFRQFHIRYIQIQHFDKVWAMKQSVLCKPLPVDSPTKTAS